MHLSDYVYFLPFCGFNMPITDILCNMTMIFKDNTVCKIWVCIWTNLAYETLVMVLSWMCSIHYCAPWFSSCLLLHFELTFILANSSSFVIVSLQAIASQRMQLACSSHWKPLANFVIHFRYVECWYFLKAFCDSASRGNFVTRLHEYVNVYESFYISADISPHTATYGHHGFPCMLIRPCIWAPLILPTVYMGTGWSIAWSLPQRCSSHCKQQHGRCPKILPSTQHWTADLEGIVCAVNRCSGCSIILLLVVVLPPVGAV